MTKIVTQLGIVGMRPRGVYSNTAAYERLDIVDVFGGSYLSLKTQTGVSPVENETDENWQCLAAKGDKGIAGGIGVKGEKGDKGDTGIQGIQGEKGDTGEQGMKGDKGQKGEKGDTGETGLQGSKGEKGDQGIQGEKGDKGDKGADGTSVNILGTKESEAELPSTASQGDAYLIGGNLWVYDGSGWNNAGEIKGPQGEKGEPGIQGIQGEKGDTGETGLQGSKGEKGDQGIQGEKGDKGDKGDNGEPGQPGEKGERGESGAQGEKGEKGDTGEQGMKGDKGEIGLKGETGDKGSTGAKGDKGTEGSTFTPSVTDGVLNWTNNGELPNPEGVSIQGADGATPEIGENENWWIGGIDTCKPSRGEGADLTKAARSYYEEIVIPIDGTEVESKHINPTGMITPNEGVVFLAGKMVADGRAYVFGTTTMLIYARTTLYSISVTTLDEIKRTIQIAINTDGPLTYKHTAGTNSQLGDTTIQLRMIVLNAAYMQGTYKYDKILANNTWDQIAEASRNGCANMLWNIGDEIDIELPGGLDRTTTLRIADFNHDDLEDGSGKAGITFACKECMLDLYAMGPPHDVNNPDDYGKSWSGSEMYKTTMPLIFDSLTDDLKRNIRPIIKETGFGVSDKPGSETSINKLFLFSESEIAGEREITVSNGNDGKQYPIFTDVENRRRETWLRSPIIGGYAIVTWDKSIGSSPAEELWGAWFGFCV